jgi:hypothetical protein
MLFLKNTPIDQIVSMDEMIMVNRTPSKKWPSVAV